jgi:hypothetical protein
VTTIVHSRAGAASVDATLRTDQGYNAPDAPPACHDLVVSTGAAARSPSRRVS